MGGTPLALNEELRVYNGGQQGLVPGSILATRARLRRLSKGSGPDPRASLDGNTRLFFSPGSTLEDGPGWDTPTPLSPKAKGYTTGKCLELFVWWINGHISGDSII